MLKFLKKYYYVVFIPLCTTIGIIREHKIEAYESSIGQPTMSGIFALYAYVFIGICLTVMTIILKGIGHSKIRRLIKKVLIILVLLIGIPLIIFAWLFI